MSAGKTLKEAEGIFLALLIIGLMGLLFLIIYGNLSGNLGFNDVSTTITNETIAIGITTGISTISEDASTPNFVSWNATRVINHTLDAEGQLNNTLLE
ncbi:unnamed protein product, partial [marine sediment metagenome]